MEQEATFLCPYCGEEITMLFDTTVASQSYIEDCEVCCRPIQIVYEVENGILASVFAERST